METFQTPFSSNELALVMPDVTFPRVGLRTGAECIPPVDLDPTDPCTPALVFFRATYGSESVLARWRKSGNSWTFTVGNNTSTQPMFRNFEEFAYYTYRDATSPPPQWVRTKWRGGEVSQGSRREPFDRFSDLWHRAARDVGQLAQASPGAFYRGVTCASVDTYKRVRERIATWHPAIMKAVDDFEELTWREKTSRIAELVSFSQNMAYLSRFVAAVNTAFESLTDDGDRLELCDCGHVEAYGEYTADYRDRTHCSSCAEELRVIDGEYYHEDDCYYWESDGEYHTESEPDDDDECSERCDSIRSWGSSTDSLCHDRSFDSSPLGDFIMGVELEVESSSGSLSDSAEHTLNHFNDSRPSWGTSRSYITLKEDGSLSDNGFEIVTAARKLEDHLSVFGSWEPHSSLRAWNPGTCGVHVHVDSRAFSALTLGKHLMLINADANQNLIKRIAGRHPISDAKARSYCAQLGQEALVTPAMALKGNCTSRYQMVNLTNLGYAERDRLKVTNTDRNCKGGYSTVELRIFRASLKKERLLAQIEFAHATVMFCRVASWGDLNEVGFTKWLKSMAGRYKNLAHWWGFNVPKANKRPGTRRTAAASADETV